MRAALSIAVAALSSTFLLACEEETQAIGFSLPPGDQDAGRAVFLEMACNDCHSIVGHDELRADATPFMDVALGGPSVRMRTYGELVTSVINPSHRIAPENRGAPFVIDGVSQMENYNDALTVSELIDLVAFLQVQYELVDYPSTVYQNYYYP